MGYLILKDLMLQKRMLLLAFAYVLIFTFAFQQMGEGQLIAIVSAVGYMFVLMGGAWEEKNSADKLWNSLPVAKWKVVAAKFLSVPVYGAIVIAIYWIVSTVFAALRIPIAAVPLDLVGGVLGIGAIFMAASLYYPVYFAVGYTRARYWHFILFFALVSFGSFLPRLFPKKPAWIEPLLERLPKITSDAMFLATFGGVIALIVLISFLLSLKLYERREF